MAHHAPRGRDEDPVAAHARPAGKGGGNCGTGAGGFGVGNTCGCHAHRPPARRRFQAGNARDGAPDQSDRAVQLAHRRFAKSERGEGHSHGDDVRTIFEGKDAGGRIARSNPRAATDARAIAGYEPAAGTVALGHKPGRPDEAEARAITRLRNKLRRGHDLTIAEHDRIVDREVSRVGGFYDDSDAVGHRYLVHDRLTGRNDLRTDADLRADSRSRRQHLIGSHSHGRHVVTRQFDSQGVEVPVDPQRFRAALRDDAKIARREDHRQDAEELARERAAGRRAPRAAFGTPEAK